MNAKHFAALIGFAFVAAWIGFNFGYAVLCLGGAGAFYAVASYAEGGLDLAELGNRFGPGGAGPRSPSPARPRAGARVR